MMEKEVNLIILSVSCYASQLHPFSELKLILIAESLITDDGEKF